MDIKIVESLPCTLSPDEKLDFAQQIAAFEIEIFDITSEKKLVFQTFNTRLKELKTKIEEMSRSISTGQVNREVEVQWIMNDPHIGQKTMYRLDTAERVRSEAMDEKDDPKLFEV